MASLLSIHSLLSQLFYFCLFVVTASALPASTCDGQPVSLFSRLPSDEGDRDDSGGLSMAGKIGLGVGIPAGIAVIAAIGVVIHGRKAERRDEESGEKPSRKHTKRHGSRKHSSRKHSASSSNEAPEEYKGYY